MAIVVASADPGAARGVIIINYNYAFPLFAHHFDLRRIAEHYHIVLEPSWTGFCNEDFLTYTLLRPNPVFIESIETYDNRFLDAIQSNLVRIPVGGNWWVDHRVMSPDPAVEKDLDFVMIASWADFKRHHRFFNALRSLRRNGHRLRGACAGYPSGRTLADIKAEAAWYGVSDQIEFYELIPPSEVAVLMRRAKVNVVWSRKEGFNRVVIEGMFCGVPGILRQGHNYGDHYPYINDQTGRFSTENSLPRDLLELSQCWTHYRPRDWVMEHMTPQIATQIIEREISRHCVQIGEQPPEPLAVKTVGLNGMEYWDRGAAETFACDYEFLRGQIRFADSARPRAARSPLAVPAS